MTSGTTNLNRKQRSVGIELLRIISMLSVMVLHVLGQGGILEKTNISQSQYGVAWFLEVLCFFGVTTYALISGFVGIDGNYRLSSIVYVWLQVVFYTVIITCIFAVAVPGSVGGYDIVAMLTPVTSGQYWYFSAYFGMFFLIPLVNLGINALKKSYLNAIFVLVVLFFSILSCISYSDVFSLKEGYSVLWLLACYFIGAYMKRFKIFEKIKSWKLICIIVLCVVLTWGFKIVLDIFTQSPRSGLLIAYNSPTVLLMSMALVVLFARMKFADKCATEKSASECVMESSTPECGAKESGDATELQANTQKPTLRSRIRKVILKIAPLSFGVYLINTNPYIFRYLMKDRFAHLANYPSLLLAISVILNALVIFLVCIAIDAVRKLIFDLCGLREKLYIIEKKICEHIDGNVERTKI